MTSLEIHLELKCILVYCWPWDCHTFQSSHLTNHYVQSYYDLVIFNRRILNNCQCCAELNKMCTYRHLAKTYNGKPMAIVVTILNDHGINQCACMPGAIICTLNIVTLLRSNPLRSPPLCCEMWNHWQCDQIKIAKCL